MLDYLAQTVFIPGTNKKKQHHRPESLAEIVQQSIMYYTLIAISKSAKKKSDF